MEGRGGRLRGHGVCKDVVSFGVVDFRSTSFLFFPIVDVSWASVATSNDEALGFFGRVGRTTRPYPWSKQTFEVVSFE